MKHMIRMAKLRIIFYGFRDAYIDAAFLLKLIALVGLKLLIRVFQKRGK